MIFQLAGVVCVLVVLLAWCWQREYRKVMAVSPEVQSAGSRYVILTVLVVLVLTLAAYLLYGLDPELETWVEDQHKYAKAVEQLAQGASPDQVAGDLPAGPLARALAREMSHSPTVQGWYSLAFLFSRLEAAPVAVEAARKAVEGAPDVAETRLLLANTLIQQARGKLTEEAAQELEQVLALHPGHDGALMMLAMAGSRARNYAVAVPAWQSLLDKHPDGEAADLLRKGLNHARKQRGSQQYFSRLKIEVDATEGIPAGGTLFVSVRTSGENGSAGGPPLAAKRMLVRNFPAGLSLEPENWIRDYPAADARLWLNARYSATPGASVEEAGIAAIPVQIDRSEESISLLLRSGL